MSNTNARIIQMVDLDMVDAIEHAKSKHPHFADSLGDGLNKITEEYLELVRAYNDHKDGQPNIKSVYAEAMDMLAALWRFAEMVKPHVS